MTRTLHLLITCVVVPLLVGCAHYEYDLVSPPEIAQHIGTSRFANATLSPLHYVMQADDNYLVIQVYNQGTVPIRLVGERSFVVDQNSQSHPLQSQSIGPQSFIKLILPPPPRVYYAYGPTIGYGFGYDYGWGYGYYDPFWYGQYNYAPNPIYNYYTDSDWDWTGDTEVRLTLTYQQAEDKSFSHSFVFRQKTIR